MPSKVARFESTPNPLALKCVLASPLVERAPSFGSSASTSARADGTLGDATPPLRAYRTPEQASHDPLGRALLGIPGVTAVLINPTFITINRVPTASWSTIKPGVENALAADR